MEELPEDMLHRFQRLEKNLSAEHGPFHFFGLFLRENAPNRWDIVASASWIEASHVSARKLFAHRLQKEFPIDELILVTQIAFVVPEGLQYEAAMRRIAHAVRAATGSSEVKHGLVELRDMDLFGQTIAHAYILTAQPLSVPVTA